ncbi:MAG: 2-oxoacid:acceptor oxidoreductase family protein [Clostridia bacterium]|nr:2-oxoacid:acceptor oxidoreductase family protein [Clostridia bacterium]
MKSENIIIAGFGGQGILFAGKLLAYAAMVAGKEISWLPSYGPEMRGGTANCHVVISEEPVGSPIIVNPDVLISMNRPSLDKFENSVIEGGTIVVDKSLIDRKVTRTDVRVKYVEATKIAMELGNAALANMVMVGAFLKETGAFILDEIKDAIVKNIPKTKQALAEIDIKAMVAGYNA